MKRMRKQMTRNQTLLMCVLGLVLVVGIWSVAPFFTSQIDISPDDFIYIEGDVPTKPSL